LPAFHPLFLVAVANRRQLPSNQAEFAFKSPSITQIFAKNPLFLRKAVLARPFQEFLISAQQKPLAKRQGVFVFWTQQVAEELQFCQSSVRRPPAKPTHWGMEL
jgi:hypothetical protein